MSNVPFLYVNLIAVCGYAIILMAFIAAKKTAEVKSFIALLSIFTVWTVGSILMRLQVFPGLNFWYYVSILALFCIAVQTYIFVCSFTKTKGTFLRNLWLFGTLIILILTAFGFFLKPPTPTITQEGTVFTYDMDWKIAIPYAFFTCIIVSIALVIHRAVKVTGRKAPGMASMISGCIIIAIGNLLQIIPNNIFPWDTLSGIITALFLLCSLYRKRMFRLTLLVSRGVITLGSVGVCLVVAIYFVDRGNRFFMDIFKVSQHTSIVLMIVSAVCLMGLCYSFMKKLIDAIFTREEQQNRLLKVFSNQVSKTLDTQTIMEHMSSAIQQEIPVENVYICLKEDDAFHFRHVSSPLASAAFSFRHDIPFVDYIKQGETCFTFKDFKSSMSFLSMWDSEKSTLKSLEIECILVLADNDEVIGFALLSKKYKNYNYTAGEMEFLETLGSISAIAMKNASLFEQVAREARTDALTEAFNYRYFCEVIKKEFIKEENDSIALAFVDIDDFKLYNQLYGSNEGDTILKEIAGILIRNTGDSGYVFRYSGKSFAILLPNYDYRMAKNLIRKIQIEITQINGAGPRASHKKITASCGICVSPHGASTWDELVDNTDLAVYKAKHMGKDRIVTFTSSDSVTYNLRKKVDKIINFDSNTVLGDSSATIFALIAAIDAKDHYTAQHSKNVAKYAAILAAAYGMNDDQIRMVHAAGLLHDIGKISIPESILGKSDKLTDEEFQLMKGHVNGSIDMIRHLPSMDYLIPAAIGHHERWDGKGYPRGTKGEEIPLAARCLAIADSFDAMTTDRPYRKGLSIEYATEQIKEHAGSQFDPKLAEVFIKLIEEKEITLPRSH